MPPSTLNSVEEPPPSQSRENGRGKAASDGARRPNLVFWGLACLVVLMATVALPEHGVWLGVKAFALEVAGIGLAAFIFSRGEWTRSRVRAALLAPPNLLILGFLVWVGVSAARSDLPQYSRYEAMRHLGGGLVYFCVVYGLSVRRHLGQFVGALALAGSLAALMAFASILSPAVGSLATAYRNEQLLAGVLCILLPVMLIASQTDEDPWRRQGALAASVLMGIALVASQNRSAWMGTAIGLLLLFALYLRFAPLRQGWTLRLDQIVVPLVVVVIAAGVFLGLSRQGGGLAQRARTLSALGEQKSYDWRIGMWSKAMRMTLDRPLWGWGVGTFPLNQALYYHPNVPSREQWQIQAGGPTLSENAHNTYLQLAAELGLPGILLYLGLLGAFFGTALRAAGRMKWSLRQGVLLASVAGVTGQMVSAFSNPAWEYAECSGFLWLILGLGMVAAGLGDRGLEARPHRSTQHSGP